MCYMCSAFQVLSFVCGKWFCGEMVKLHRSEEGGVQERVQRAVFH